MPTFSQKHYKLLAQFVASLDDSEMPSTRRQLAQMLEAFLSVENPRFSPGKWFTACGVQS